MSVVKNVLYCCLLIIVIGCAAGNNQFSELPTSTSPDKKKFRVPAGVDTAVAYSSRRKAEHLFVIDPKREQLADSLNKSFSDYLKMTEDIYMLLNNKREQFKKIRQEYKKATESVKGKEALSVTDKHKYNKAFAQITEDSLTISIVTSLLDYYLNYCYEHFQQATRLNPFDLNGLINQAACHWDRGNMFNDTLAFRHAIKALEGVLKHNKGVASIYREIGKNYYKLGQWQKAYEYLYRARDIYVVTAYFDHPDSGFAKKFRHVKLPLYVDADYYDYLFWKGEAEIKTYRADSALTTLQMALALAPTKNDSDYIKYRITEWIKWDDGNIYAAEQKWIINDSLNHQNYKWAKKAYLRLLPRLKTKKAYDEISWRLAKIQYIYLKEPVAAAERLYNVIIKSDTTGRKAPFVYKAPEDSLYKLYFKDCGDMLYAMGTKFLKQGLRDEARKYFARDTTFEWAGRGKAFLPLAQVVNVPDNIPPQQRLKLFNEKRLRLLSRAKMYIKEFEPREINMLYRTLNEIYRQKRDRIMLQRLQQEYMQIMQKQKKK